MKQRISDVFLIDTVFVQVAQAHQLREYEVKRCFVLCMHLGKVSLHTMLCCLCHSCAGANTKQIGGTLLRFGVKLLLGKGISAFKSLVD